MNLQKPHSWPESAKCVKTLSLAKTNWLELYEWINEWKPFIASIHGKSHKTRHNHNRQKVVSGSNAFVLRLPNICLLYTSDAADE